MAKRVTIKDIARRAGVSLGSVHCALAGKTGVGDDTRKRILAIAKKSGYRPNAVAASLKRKTLTIAAAFPEPVGENRYYFSPIWKGVRDCLESVGDFNVSLVELPYRKGKGPKRVEMEALRDQGELDGILTTGFMDDFGQASIARFGRRGVPMILVGDDAPQSGRLCCVQTDYWIVGRIMAELLSRQVAGDGTILLSAGHSAIPSHYQVASGFDEYLREKGLDNMVSKVHTESLGADAGRALARELRRHKDLVACAGVNARGSVLLARALMETGLAGTMPAIGSDLFRENIAYLRTGVFTNLVHKNQYRQAYLAARLLVDCLLRDARPPEDVVIVASEIIFQSGVPMLDADGAAPFV